MTSTISQNRPSLYYSKEFYKKRFSAATMKAAYMDACKWYATNVLSKDDLHNVQVEYEKLQNESIPTVQIRLFAVLNEDELRERHCKICKECHTAFYMNSTAPCSKCEAKAYQWRMDDMLRVKIEYYRGLIRKACGPDTDEEESTEETETEDEV